MFPAPSVALAARPQHQLGRSTLQSPDSPFVAQPVFYGWFVPALRALLTIAPTLSEPVSSSDPPVPIWPGPAVPDPPPIANRLPLILQSGDKPPENAEA